MWCVDPNVCLLHLPYSLFYLLFPCCAETPCTKRLVDEFSLAYGSRRVRNCDRGMSAVRIAGIREGLKLKLPGNILSYIHTLSRPQWVGWAQCTKHPNTLWDFLILLSQCPAALLLWEGIRKDWLNGCSSYVHVWGPAFILKKHSRFKLCGFYSQSLLPHFLF